jgi:hypothetical protein
VADWGDFSWVAEAIGDRSIATKGYANQEHDWIWYIPSPAPQPDNPEVMVSTGATLLIGSNRTISLLQRDDGRWRVHGVGDYWLPDGSRTDSSCNSQLTMMHRASGRKAAG